jgi:hypothetical protein
MNKIHNLTISLKHSFVSPLSIIYCDLSRTVLAMCLPCNIVISPERCLLCAYLVIQVLYILHHCSVVGFTEPLARYRYTWQMGCMHVTSSIVRLSAVRIRLLCVQQICGSLCVYAQSV